MTITYRELKAEIERERGIAVKRVRQAAMRAAAQPQVDSGEMSAEARRKAQRLWAQRGRAAALREKLRLDPGLVLPTAQDLGARLPV